MSKKERTYSIVLYMVMGSVSRNMNQWPVTRKRAQHTPWSTISGIMTALMRDDVSYGFR